MPPQDLSHEIAALRERVARLERRGDGFAPIMNETRAAHYLGRSQEFLRKLRLRGEGPKAVRRGTTWEYRRTHLDEWLDAGND
jgi:hypothetical protein